MFHPILKIRLEFEIENLGEILEIIISLIIYYLCE